MTNKELGRKIWENINFTNCDYDDTYADSFYADKFDSWYRDCFAECMQEAANSILNGSCTWENGSFIEVSRSISKSGNPVTFNVEKENFIEFYGEEMCRNIFMNEKMFMNPATGSVDSYDGWWYENENGEKVNAVDLGEVVEVEKSISGEWVEV